MKKYLVIKNFPLTNHSYVEAAFDAYEDANKFAQLSNQGKGEEGRAKYWVFEQSK